MTRTPVSDIRHCGRHDRRTRQELFRCVAWIVVSAYITVGAYLDGVLGGVASGIAVGWIWLVLLREEHR